jgi:hypothetical protein
MTAGSPIEMRERAPAAAVDASGGAVSLPRWLHRHRRPRRVRRPAGRASQAGLGHRQKASCNAGAAMRERCPRTSERVGSFGSFEAVAVVSILRGPKSILDFRAIARFAGRHTGLRQIDGVTLQIRELAILQRRFVGRAKHHARRLSCFERFLPARRAETPAVAGFKSRKAEFRDRR